MKYLLDTQALLWIISDDQRLTPKVKKTFLNSSNEIFLSIASLWEMAIKISLGKLFIEGSLEEFTRTHILGNGIRFFNILPAHLYRLENLPFHHRDPFDRLILAQAETEQITLISSDHIFDKYPVKRLWE